VLQRKSTANGLIYYFSPLLENAGVPHAFSTRIGGVSDAPFNTLNLGNPSPPELQDDKQHIQENYRRLQQAIGCEKKSRCWVHQVHRADVVLVRRDHEFTSGAAADALVSDDPDHMLAVRYADCVPILLASADGKFVAAVHAGWRGIIANAVGAAIRELRRISQSNHLLAAIGPCIGFDAFEVSEEVLSEFKRVFPINPPIRDCENGKGRADLREAVARQLSQAGLQKSQIEVSDRCTFRDADEFFSHRRDHGITGRMAALIAPRIS
jgi:YfiH family protein